MRILIADDASGKIGAINNVLRGISSEISIKLEKALDLVTAKEMLSKNYYDLLVLDLNMPYIIGDTPSIQSGLDFVDEIIETEKIKKPIEILVLSAFDSSVEQFRKQVERSGITAVHFSENENEWKEILKSKVDYIHRLNEQRRFVPAVPPCDVLLVTAVTVEKSAVMSWDCCWNDFSVENDPTAYRSGILNIADRTINLVHMQLSDMGMTSSACLVTKGIVMFNPKYVIMTGIAAGLDKDAQIGDIMIATETWDYSSGKYVGGEDHEVSFLPDPKTIQMDRGLQGKFVSSNYDDVLKKIQLEYRGEMHPEHLNIHFGKFACGVAVVASKEIVEQQVRAHSRKVLGLDMESYGVYYAALSSSPNVKSIVIKSISDFADINKGDKDQEYAAYTSAAFAKYLIESVLEI